MPNGMFSVGTAPIVPSSQVLQSAFGQPDRRALAGAMRPWERNQFLNTLPNAFQGNPELAKMMWFKSRLGLGRMDGPADHDPRGFGGGGMGGGTAGPYGGGTGRTANGNSNSLGGGGLY